MAIRAAVDLVEPIELFAYKLAEAVPSRG